MVLGGGAHLRSHRTRRPSWTDFAPQLSLPEALKENKMQSKPKEGSSRALFLERIQNTRLPDAIGGPASPPPQTWQGWPHKRTRSACISERQCRGGMSVTGVQGPRSDPVPLRGPVLNENSQCHRPRARRFQSESVLVMTKSKPCRADQGCRGLRTKRQGVGLCRGPPGIPG